MPFSLVATIGSRFDLERMAGNLTGNFPVFNDASFVTFTLPWLVYGPLHPPQDYRGYSQSLTTRIQANVQPNLPHFDAVNTIQGIIDGGDLPNYGLVFRSFREGESLTNPLPDGYEAFYQSDSLYVSRASEFFGAIGDATPRRRFAAMAANNESWFCWWPNPGFVLEYRPTLNAPADPFNISTWRAYLRNDLTIPTSSLAKTATVPRGSFTSSPTEGHWGNDNLQILRLFFPRKPYDPPSIQSRQLWYDEDEANAGVGRLEISDNVFTTLPQQNKSILVNRARDGEAYLGQSMLIDGTVFDVVLVSDEPQTRFRPLQRLTLIARGEE